jgi:DNA helicase-2/ATP-dependent DNA helicase PcrA
VAGELSRIRGFFDKVRSASGHESSSAVIEEPPVKESIPAGAFPPGTRVTSPRFGRGVITAATGTGDGLTYTVRFSEAGEKRIVARFGMLEKE